MATNRRIYFGNYNNNSNNSSTTNSSSSKKKNNKKKAKGRILTFGNVEDNVVLNQPGEVIYSPGTGWTEASGRQNTQEREENRQADTGKQQEQTVELQREKAERDGATATSPNRMGVDLIGNINRSGRFNVRKAATEPKMTTMNGKTAADFPAMDTESARLKVGKQETDEGSSSETESGKFKIGRWDIDDGNIGNVSGPESATIPQDLMQAAWDEYLQTAVPRGAANVTGTGQTDIQGALEAMQGWTEDYWNTAAADGARNTGSQAGTGSASRGSTNLQGARDLMQRANENYWNTTGNPLAGATDRPGNNGVLEYGADSYAARTAEAQLEDENSKLNQVTRWRSSAPRIHDRYTVQDEQDWAEWEQEGIRLGQYNQGDDYRKWNGEKLEREIGNLQRTVDAKGNVSAPGNTEIKTAQQRMDEIAREEGSYSYFDLNGVVDPNDNGRVLRGRPDDYAGDMEIYYDSLIYDQVYGEGAYVRAIEAQNEETDRAIEFVDDIWDGLENNNLEERRAEAESRNSTEKEQLQARIDGTDRNTSTEEDLLRKYQARLNNLNSLDELMQNANGDTSYHPELIEKPYVGFNVEHPTNAESDVTVIAKGDRTDQAYYYINNSWLDSMAEEQFSDSPYAYNLADVYHLDGDSRPENYLSNIHEEYFMTQREKDAFNIHYNKYLKDGDEEEKLKAQAVLDGVSASLDSRRTKYFEEVQREKASGHDEGELMAVVYGLMTVPENVIAGFSGLVNTARAFFGDESVADPNSGNWIWQNTVNATRDERAKKWGDAFVQMTGNEDTRAAGEFLNRIFYSIADNIAAKQVAGGSYGDPNKLTEGIIQLVMSSEATSNTMVQELANNKSPTEAAIYAIADGVIEAATEKFDWLETDTRDLMGNKGDLIRFMATAATEEGIEEVESDVLGSVFDGVMSLINGHKTEIERDVDELVSQGMNRGDAENQVLKNYFRDLGISFLGGALSGIGLSGSNVTMTKVGTVFDTRRNAAAAIENDNIGTILQAARGVQGSEEYNQKVEELSGKYEKNGTLSTQEAVTLFRIMRETNNTMAEEAAKDEAVNVLKEEILAKMDKLGERASGEQVTAAAQGAAELLTGEGKLNAEQKEALAQIPGAMDVIQDVISAGTAANEKARTRIQEATEPYRVSENSIREAGRKWQASSGAQAAAENARVATAEEKQAASGKSTGSATEVIADGEYADIVRKEGDSYIVRTSEGTEKTVDAADVIATGTAAATIMKWGENNRHAVSDTFINTALNMSKTGAIQDTAKFLDQAMGIRLAAYTGQAMPQTSMRTEIAQALYNTSLKDAQADRKTATARQTERKKDGGRATFNGAEYGTEAWNTAMKEAGLTRQQRTQAEALAEIYQRIGLDVNFENDTENDGVYGAYNAETGVTTINLAGTNANGEQHHAMVTAGHELTHFLEQNGGEAYEQLRQYVFDSMKQHGLNINQAVMNKMDRYNAAYQEQGSEQTIGIDGAIAEIIADSCDQILGNENVIRHIEETKPTLFNSIKNFVSNFIERVREAFTGMSRSASRESLNFLRDSNELARKWLGAYDSAISAEIRQAETVTAEDVKAAETETEETVTTAEAEPAEEAGTMPEKTNIQRRVEVTTSDKVPELSPVGDDILVENTEDSRPLVLNSDGESIVRELPGGTVVSEQLSLRTWTEDEIRRVTTVLKKQGYTENQISDWISDINSIAAIVAADRGRLDFEADTEKTMLKKNAEYSRTLDASTLCAKRLLYQGTFNAVQHQLENTALLPQDLIDLSNLLRDLGYETPCGICYVESRRRQLGNFAEQWLETYEGAYKPTVGDVTTTDGLEALRKSDNPAKKQAYKDFIEAMNKKGVVNPKVVQLRTDYRGEIRRMPVRQVQKVKNIGGLRIQSFSDFEVPHLLDMMQAVLDMHTKGLTAQAYTKVPEFAAVFGDTGIKINLSLIGKGTGLDSNGNLVFDDVEGMPFDKAMELRNRYSKNVGTILVGINDQHILRAMADDRIDFIIPFHKSGWSHEELMRMPVLNGYEDYTNQQNERKIVAIREDGTYETESLSKSKEENYQPVGKHGYWNFDLSGKENAELYLEKCKQDGRIPKFSRFLVDNGDGSFSLQPDGSTDGYWKTLIDFKMYDNQGNKAEQMPVQPKVNMQEAERVLGEYSLERNGIKRESNNDLPVATEVVNRFVEQYKKTHQKEQYSLRIEGDADVIGWMDGLTEEELGSETERAMLREYRNLQGQIAESREKTNNFLMRLNQVRQVMADQWEGNDEFIGWTPAQLRDEARKMEINLKTEAGRMERLQNELGLTTTGQGYASLMYRQNHIVNDYITGNTKEMVQKTVSDMMEQVRNTREEINQRAERLKTLAENKDVAFTRSFFAESNMKESAAELKKTYQSRMSGQEIQDRLASISMKMTARKDFTAEASDLAARLIDTQKSQGAESYILDSLRGTTIHLSATQLKQLKGEHRSIKEVRSILAGTGIKVLTGGDMLNTLDKNWDSLCDMIPTLHRDAPDTDMLNELLDVIQSEKQLSQASFELTGEAYQEALSDAMTEVMGRAALMKANMPTDPASRNQIKQMAQYMSQLALEAEDSAKALEQMQARMDELEMSGAKARATASWLERDLNKAVEYYDTLVKQSMDAKANRERQELIDKLNSRATEALLKQEAKYKQQIEKSKKVRELAEEKKKIRKQISTVTGRIRKLLVNETDQKNVPEHMKPLAREALRMIIDNDLGAYGGRKITGFDSKMILDTKRVLDAWTEQDGKFDGSQLEFTDKDIREQMLDALADIEDGIMFYNSGKGYNETQLFSEKSALERVQQGLNEIYGVIQSERSIWLNDKRVEVEDQADKVNEEMKGSRFKGEWIGSIGSKIGKAREAVIYGNMTPEYFFKNLKNAGMTELWDEYHRGENKNGLLIQSAKDRLAEIAEKHGYAGWDLTSRKDIKLEHGGTVRLNTEQIMSLYATWKREMTYGPENSSHLTQGGFFADEGQDENRKIGREIREAKAKRVTGKDMEQIEAMLTDAQKAYVDEIVGYLSKDMSELGNEASMKMYGIRKYKEKYYFPFKTWDGVKSVKSDAGVAGNTENRAAHKSWSNRRVNNAKTPVVIEGFTQTAAQHVVEMINYNTMAVAIENMNKVLNVQFTETESGVLNGPDATKRNLRTIFGEKYGSAAIEYLTTLQQDLNGGVGQKDSRKTLKEALLSTFRKNAVAGSLSVALQQPMSYLRAGMMINPKYLARAISPDMWKGSWQEMISHSGVAVIKEMGRFDMNFGRTAREYIQPENTKTDSRIKKAGAWISDKSTMLPNLMDRITWTRMWSACKAEQAAAHPEMDKSSDAFLDIVGERFNDIMRKTQVYESILVRSANMRKTDSYAMKTLTSFMAEPTLSINVLADAIMNAKEKGGKAYLAKAAAIYMISAAAQAVIKGFVSAGRTPDDKKTEKENILNKIAYNFVSEINPLGLIPGYNDIIEALTQGKLTDNSMSVVGKLKDIKTATINLITGEDKYSPYRYVEDSLGQLMQIISGVPMKNLMRDGRAVYNLFSGAPYNRDRETSADVLKWQAIDTLNSKDILGAVNEWLGKAGYQTSNTAYYERIYEAQKAGDTEAAESMKNYLILGKGIKGDSLSSELKSLAKNDETLSYEERVEFMKENGMSDADAASWILSEYKEGDLTREEAEKEYKKANPEKTDDDVFFAFDRVDFEKGTGKKVTGNYYRLVEAIDENDEKKVREALKTLYEHGCKEDEAASKVTDEYSKEKISRANAEKLYRTVKPSATDDDVFFAFDRKDFKKETGKSPGSNEKYYRLYDAIDNNKAESITQQVKAATSRGAKASDIRGSITNKYKKQYLELKSGSAEKVKMKDALIKAYKALGMTGSEAEALINGWKKSDK